MYNVTVGYETLELAHVFGEVKFIYGHECWNSNFRLLWRYATMSKNNKTINELKDILRKRWKEKEKRVEISYEEAFQETVDEAVYKIIRKWQTKAKMDEEYNERTNKEVVLSTNNLFFVSSETRGVYSNDCNLEIYPKTGHVCFFKTLFLPTIADENMFIASVMKQLPEGTICEITKREQDGFSGGNYYSFKIKIDPKEI